MFFQNGSRRRTSGGTFLKFVKDVKLSKKEYEEIFLTAEEFNSNRKYNRPKKSFKGKGETKVKRKPNYVTVVPKTITRLANEAVVLLSSKSFYREQSLFYFSHLGNSL